MKKILETFKRKWAEYLLEVFVITIGILGAYALNNWNENRKDRLTEFSVLNSLKSEFQINKERLVKHSEIHSRTLKKAQDYSTRLMTGEVTEFSDIWINGKISRFGTYDPINGAINSLISTGRIEVIKNDSLKTLLSSWHTIVADYREEGDWDREFVLDQWVPFLMKHFPNRFNGYPNDSLLIDKESKKIYVEKIKPSWTKLIP